LRAYCVASGALSLYLYDRVLSLFSSVPYTSPSTLGNGDITNNDLSAHLTNTSLQADKGEAFVRLFDELVGCHVLSYPGSGSSSQPRGDEGGMRRGPRRMMGQAMDVEKIREDRALRAAEQQSHREVFAEEDLEDIITQMSEALSETFKAALDMSVHFQPLPNAFELYGIDFLVTHADASTNNRKYQVHLLEVNSEPAIELTGPRLQWILEDLFRSIAETFVEPFFSDNQDSKEVPWKVGETRNHLRKCLDIEVRGAGSWAK